MASYKYFVHLCYNLIPIKAMRFLNLRNYEQYIVLFARGNEEIER